MDQPTSADTRLSNYRLERLLGSGGMGSVYLARDLALDRPVAIKFIAPEKAGDASARRRLIREARAAASLDHPNICGVHEVIDSPDGRACIVMPYVEGRTLADVLREGPLDVRRALTITADLASALAAAHKHGIIHRDLKPQNIMLTNEQHAKLLDFGVARHTDASAVRRDGTTTTQLTTPGVIVGTPPYMSPEQVLQRPLDGRSDLFALGTVLFESLTGRRPFNGQSGLEQVGEVLHRDPPPVSSLRSELTDQHDELVRRLLAKAPEDRFGSADELLGALRVLLPDDSSSRWRTEHATSSTRWLRTPGARRRGFAAAAAIIILAAAGVWRWSRPNITFDAPPEARDSYELGTEWIRRGAYSSGRRALSEAVQAAPGFVLGYVRLAEAAVELDDYETAEEALLTVTDLVPNINDLNTTDRLRFDAVRSQMLRKRQDAINAYQEIANRTADPGSLLDLGRVQEAAGQLLQARDSYLAAIQLRENYAAAHLRLGIVLGRQNDRKALAHFDRADELYATQSNEEGRVEVMLRRGGFLSVLGEFTEARAILEEALHLANVLKLPEHQIRASQYLSGVLASQGSFREARDLATTAAERAIAANLDTVAANTLIDLGTMLLYQPREQGVDEETHFSNVEGLLQRAIDLAKGRQARLTLARASLQLASAKEARLQPQSAIEHAEGQLDFLRENGYVRHELDALSIISRSYEAQGRFEEARKTAQDVLEIAREIKNEAQEAVALDSLAGQAAAMGILPQAEGYWSESGSIRRRQNDLRILPYDLTNRAEMLIRLGRDAEAEPLLREVEEGIARKLDGFVARERRAVSLRILQATIRGRFQHAIRATATFAKSARPLDEDAAGRLAQRLRVYGEAQLGGRAPSPARPWMDQKMGDSVLGREQRYWELFAALTTHDPGETLREANRTLEWRHVQVSPEVEWRIAAIAAAAAHAAGDAPQATALAARARAALQRAQSSWHQPQNGYLQRRDLVLLMRKAGMD